MARRLPLALKPARVRLPVDPVRSLAGRKGPTTGATTSALRTLSVAVVSVSSSQSTTTPVRLHRPWRIADEQGSLSSRSLGRFKLISSRVLILLLEDGKSIDGEFIKF